MPVHTPCLTRRKSLQSLLSTSALATLAALATLTVSQKAHAGWGYCTVSGCGCKAFMGTQDLCTNCGHNYSLHE